MNKKLLEILVCPFDKVTQLDLIEFKAGSATPQETSNSLKENDARNFKISESKNLKIRGTKDNYNKANVTSEETTIVEEGLLLCKACLRFYPIIEEIPIILPDELRDKKKDIDFLKKWKESIPKNLVDNLKPWTV